PLRDAEDSGDLPDRSLFDVMEDEDRPLVVVQSREGTPDRVIVGQEVDRSRIGRGARLGEPLTGHRDLVDGLPTPAADDVPACVDDDSPEPGVDATAMSPPRQ